MASQPIYGEDGAVVDHYDDGQPEPEPMQGTGGQREETPPAQTEEEHAVAAGWTVPDMLKGTDLFIGMTVHRDDGDPRGPRISLFARELPDGTVTVKTYRAAELSQHAFLDNLQKAVAATMQAHFLAGMERQRKRLEEEAKRKARASTKTVASIPTPPTSPTAASTPAQKPAATGTSKRPEPKYTTVSMFD